jgi:hypothetical protein
MNRTFTAIAIQSVIAAAIIAAAPLASAGSAVGATYVDPGADHVLVRTPFVSTTSREQVRAEAVAAARQPLSVTDSQNAPKLAPFASTVSRAQVHAEAVEATRQRLVLGTETQREMNATQVAEIQNAGLRASTAQGLVAVKR